MRLVYFLDIARMAVNVGIVGYRRFHILEHFLILCFRFSGDSQRKYVVPGQKRLDRVTFQDAVQGIHVIQIFEVKGGLQILNKYPDILSIFILPPSMDSLERRLRRRGTEDEETIRKRLAQAAEEISYKDRYKYNVVNGDLETAINEVLDILHKEDENLIK